MGRKRKRNEQEKELLVVESDYRPPRCCSRGLWKKRLKNLREAEEKKIREARDKALAEAWCKVWETDGFDMGNLRDWYMLPFSGKNCPLVVTLYAKLGLHRHNMLEGTKLQLLGIVKYNRRGMNMPASYFITSRAYDHATTSLVAFQTEVDEEEYNAMNVTCHIARLQKTGTKCVDDWDTAPSFYHCMQVPEWPLNFADKNRFYEVQKSEWEENDWIRLYLELAFVTTNRNIPNWRLFKPDLSDLKILKAVVETEEPPNASVLKSFRNAVVYITYDHYMSEGKVRKRRAIVRRSVDLTSKRFCLVGKISRGFRGKRKLCRWLTASKKKLLTVNFVRKKKKMN